MVWYEKSGQEREEGDREINGKEEEVVVKMVGHTLKAFSCTVRRPMLSAIWWRSSRRVLSLARMARFGCRRGGVAPEEGEGEEKDRDKSYFCSR